MPLPTLPQSFVAKKQKILANLSIPSSDYADKSPKGSVDVQIHDLIAQVNRYEGLVTTSSCAGRVSVFVEGESGCIEGGKGGTGGKGGGRWIFIGHEPIATPDQPTSNDASSSFIEQFGLQPSQTDNVLGGGKGGKLTRLIRFSFEPLILHILCASLRHAKPLLSAAISSGFRESGVQSLKSLDDGDACPMVAVRTVGVGFESVIGVVMHEDGEEVCRAAVCEEYLRMCVDVINRRFEENGRRRERFAAALKEAMNHEGPHAGSNGWEEKEARRERKRLEGLERQKMGRKDQEQGDEEDEDGVDGDFQFEILMD